MSDAHDAIPVSGLLLARLRAIGIGPEPVLARAFIPASRFEPWGKPTGFQNRQFVLGYSRAYTVERLYRDARVTRVYDGTSEIQRIVIARDILRGGAAGV